MQHRNLYRSLIARHGVSNFSKKSRFELRAVHVNVLYTIYLYNRLNAPVSASKICLFLCKIQRGSDQNYINRLIKELLDMELLNKGVYGRQIRYNTTIRGNLTLNSLERMLRKTRID